MGGYEKAANDLSEGLKNQAIESGDDDDDYDDGELGESSSKPWPAITQAGTQCKRCLNLGRGNFCYQHDC